MPLLLLDLDNTLLPRDAAFRAWAQDLLAERDLPPGDVDWFVTIDGGGYVPRSTVLSAVRRRYGLDDSFEFLLAHYRRGINAHIHCPTRHVQALRTAREAGWTLGIVSNGNTRPQLEKIRRTGLGPLVDGWVISEEADCVKPDPLIFEIAAQRCGVAPTGDWTADTWMIGDHAPADIAGAELTGLRSVWLHHGRPWAEPGYRPTLKAAGLPEAIGQVLSARGAPGLRPGIRAGGAARRRLAVTAPGPLRERARAVTARAGARPGAQLPAPAPDGVRAPNAGSTAWNGLAAPTAEIAVRNRSGGFAAAGGARSTDAAGLPGAAGPSTTAASSHTAPYSHTVALTGTAALTGAGGLAAVATGIPSVVAAPRTGIDLPGGGRRTAEGPAGERPVGERPARTLFATPAARFGARPSPAVPQSTGEATARAAAVRS